MVKYHKAYFSCMQTPAQQRLVMKKGGCSNTENARLHYGLYVRCVDTLFSEMGNISHLQHFKKEIERQVESMGSAGRLVHFIFWPASHCCERKRRQQGLQNEINVSLIKVYLQQRARNSKWCSIYSSQRWFGPIAGLSVAWETTSNIYLQKLNQSCFFFRV